MTETAAEQPMGTPQNLGNIDLYFVSGYPNYSSRTVSPGDEFQVDYWIRNAGASALGEFQVSLVMSADGSPGHDGIVLTQTIESPMMTNSGEYFGSFTIPFPDLASGAYRWGIMLDPNNLILETDEINNIRSRSIAVANTTPADMSVSHLQLDGAAITPGRAFSVSFDVNAEPGVLPGTATAELLISANPTFTASRVLATINIDPADLTDGTQPYTVASTLDTSFAQGPYFIKLRLTHDLDGDEAVTENNAQTMNVTVSEIVIARGGDAADVIDGTELRDNIVGGLGNDTIFARESDDTVRGGLGNDRLIGAAGDDALFGEAGNDVVFGGTGADILAGGYGRDRINGQAGGDILASGAGNDILRGGAGNDRLLGGSGNDILIGGSGIDKIKSGIGADRIVFFANSDRTVVLDFDARGAVHDVADLTHIRAIESWNDLVINHAREVSAGVKITSGEMTFLLRGLDLGDLGAEDFLF